MVEFYDPIQKKEISYYIDKKIRQKWDKLRGGQLIKQDDDKVYIVDGRERIGKTTFTVQQAKYLDPSFDLQRICFTAEEFLYQIKNCPQGSVIIFDEAFRGLSSKASQSKVNKKIVEAMMEMGQRNLIIFIVLPTFFLLEIYAAVLRSNTLFHIYKDKSGKRKFRIYNFKEKSILYRVGKKKGFDYGFPRVRIRGNYFKHFPVNQKKYNKIKLDTFRGIKEAEEEPEKNKLLRNKFVVAFTEETGLSLRKSNKILSEKYGIILSAARLGQIIRELKGKQGKLGSEKAK